MNWLEDTHGVQFELVRHFLRRMFDGEWSSSPGQWTIGGDRRVLAVSAGGPSVGQGGGDSIRNTPSNTISSRSEGLRAAALADEIALLTLLLCVTGLIALLEWQSLFPSGRDYLALASLPVRSRQIFIARFVSVVLFSGVLIGAMNFLPSLIAPVEFGGGWRLDASYAMHAGGPGAGIRRSGVHLRVLCDSGVAGGAAECPAREPVRARIGLRAGRAGRPVPARRFL